jgi:mRNA interferase MazF
METFSVGNVVFIPFPFSDLSDIKLRPAILLSQTSREDWILCQVTSQQYHDADTIRFDEKDFLYGSLQRESYARVGKLFTAKSTLVKKKVGALKTVVIDNILRKVIDMFERSRKEL